MLGTALAYIAPAFFIARISFAAASAAGDAGFSVGAGAAGAACLAAGCCACAGAPAKLSPPPTPATATMFERYVIPILLDLRPFKAVQQREFRRILPAPPYRQGR